MVGGAKAAKSARTDFASVKMDSANARNTGTTDRVGRWNLRPGQDQLTFYITS